MKKIYIAVVVITLLGFMPSRSFAAEFGGGDHYTLSSGQTVDGNLYAGGGDVMVAGTVQGDVFLAGGTVTMSGTVQKDLMMAGGTLTMNGTVQEDMRIAGGTVIVTGSANGDVMIFGGQVTITKDAKLSKNIYVTGGQVTIDGLLDGSLHANGGTVVINGTVNGTVFAQSDHLEYGASAKIQGDSNYLGPQDQIVADGASIQGQKHFTKQQKSEHANRLPFLEVWWLMKIGMLMLSAFVLLRLLTRQTTSFVQSAMTTFHKELLRGFIILFIAPIAIFFALLTLIGIPIALFAISIYIAFLILAGVLTNVLAGSLLYKYAFKKNEMTVSWQTIVVGVVVFQIIKLIPIVGWIVAACLFLVSLGTVWNLVFQSLKAGR